MAISAADLSVLRYRGVRPICVPQCKAFWSAALISGLIIFIIGLQNESSSLDFTNLISIGGTLSLTSVIALKYIKRHPPYSPHPRKILDAKNPPNSQLITSILGDLAREYEQGGVHSRFSFYKLDSGKIYVDYYLKDSTITLSLSQLFTSIPWKNISFTRKYQTAFLSDYKRRGYLTINSFLRKKGTSGIFDSFQPEQTKYNFYRVISLAHELQSITRSDDSSPPLFRCTNLSYLTIKKTHKLGQIIRDPGFWSTSQKKLTAFFGYPIINQKICYFIKAGTRNRVKLNTAEEEFLFFPFTPFKITSMKKEKGIYQVELEEVSESR